MNNKQLLGLKTTAENVTSQNLAPHENNLAYSLQKNPLTENHQSREENHSKVRVREVIKDMVFAEDTPN